jgi:hypothetical protein
MDTFAPIFSKIVDSSLWDEPDYVVKVFLTMLAKKDMDHVVRGNAYNIKIWSRKTEKEVMDALKILSSPDKKRMEPQEHEGRRIKKVEDGWLILNGANYRKLAHDVAERVRKAKWARENKGKTTNQEADLSVENKKDLVRIHNTHAANLTNELQDGFREATT